MRSLISSLFCLSSVTATGFIYPPPTDVNPPQNLTVHEGDFIVVAYDADPSAVQVAVFLICETPINTDIVPFGIDPSFFNNTGLALYPISPGTFEGDNSDFYSNICFLALQNSTFSACFDHALNLPQPGPNPHNPVSNGTVYAGNGTELGNSTWITFIKNTSNLEPTTFSAEPTALGLLSTAVTANQTDMLLPTGSILCLPGTLTLPTGSATNYSSLLAAEATGTGFTASISDFSITSAPVSTSSVASSAAASSSARSEGRKMAHMGVGQVIVGTVGLIGFGFVL